MRDRLAKIAAHMSKAEAGHWHKGDLGPGVPERVISPLPKLKKPQTWEFSAHPHKADRAGPHIDIRLGNPETGIAHSFVLPKRADLPKPGESARVIPTYDHTIPYMDYTGKITTEYGRGKVVPGRRTQAEVYHAEPGEEPGTKLRFNLYEGKAPEEFALRRDDQGRWFLHNKTLTRGRRPDIPASKPHYKEVELTDVDPAEPTQAIMPKLDGAHVVVDLQAGRAPRVFSWRPAKVSPTGMIEHTHKLPELLKLKVPKALNGTLLRAEVVAVDPKTGRPLPSEHLSGILNSKVWQSREAQQRLGVELKVFPFSVIRHKGKELEEAPFYKKLDVLKQVEALIPALSPPPLATTPREKMELLDEVKKGKHRLTTEGVVLVEPNAASVPIKAKVKPDFDVYVREIHPAVSGKTGKPYDRAGAISYSWTPKGRVVGQLGGFKHDEARDMLSHPEDYVGRAARAIATRVNVDDRGRPGALFQGRFLSWHPEKGKTAMSQLTAFDLRAFTDELVKIKEARLPSEIPPLPGAESFRAQVGLDRAGRELASFRAPVRHQPKPATARPVVRPSPILPAAKSIAPRIGGATGMIDKILHGAARLMFRG